MDVRIRGDVLGVDRGVRRGMASLLKLSVKMSSFELDLDWTFSATHAVADAGHQEGSPKFSWPDMKSLLSINHPEIFKMSQQDE